MEWNDVRSDCWSAAINANIGRRQRKVESVGWYWKETQVNILYENLRFNTAVKKGPRTRPARMSHPPMPFTYKLRK